MSVVFKDDDLHHFVASVSIHGVPGESPGRTWCFFHDLGAANEWVYRNAGWLAEKGHYTHVVIESVNPLDNPDGPTVSRLEMWFELKYKMDFRSYVAFPATKPEVLKNLCNFTIG